MTNTLTHLQALHARLIAATQPEDAFGALPAPQTESLRKTFLALVRIAHPDHAPAEKPLAEKTFALLIHWRDQAHARIQLNLYGTAAADPKTIRTARTTYRIFEPAQAADYADLYPAESGAAQNLTFKITRDPRDNPLALHEARALQTLQSSPGSAYFPRLVEAFCAADAAAKKQALIYSAANTTHTLADIRRAYPAGIDPRDAAWIFNRLLESLYHTHAAGLIHGAILPPHIRIDTETHGLVLTEWGYSVNTGEPLTALSAAHESWYPPEVSTKTPATAALDIYMAARCLQFLIDDTPAPSPSVASASRRWAAPALSPFQNFLRACLLPAPTRRPNNAGDLREQFATLLLSLYGKPKFRPFPVPP